MAFQAQSTAGPRSDPGQSRPCRSSKQRSTCHREKPTSNSVPTGVSSGALLTKNFISLGFNTLRATTRCIGSAGKPSSSLGCEPGVLDLPDHRPFLTILDAPPLPGLVAEDALLQQFIDAPRGRAAAGQPRDLPPPSPPVFVVGPRDDPRRLQPADEIAGHLAHERLSRAVRPRKKSGLLP